MWRFATQHPRIELLFILGKSRWNLKFLGATGFPALVRGTFGASGLLMFRRPAVAGHRVRNV